MPTKRLVVCYLCGYSHIVTGQLRVSYCPKCRALLSSEDMEINAPRTGDVLTIGDVTIAPGAAFDPGAKVAGRVVRVGADVSELASITATESLVLLAGAKLGRVKVENFGGKVIVPADEKVTIEEGVCCDELEIAGELCADVRTQRAAILRSGAILRGSYAGSDIKVEEGAAINAVMRLIPKNVAQVS